MEKKIILPPNVLSNKTCCLCQHILSVPPIMVTTLEGEQYKCGRCEKVKTTTYTRNGIFEDIAKFLIFPCTYKDCSEKIPWGLIERHEINCSFRNIWCPIYYQNCTNVLQVGKVAQHFEKCHKKNLWEYNEIKELSINYDYVYLTTVENLDFFIYILHLNDLFLMKVFSMKPITKYNKYNVKLTSNTGDEFSVVYEKQTIDYYNEREQCFKCIRGLCDVKYHPFSKDNQKQKTDFTGFTKFKKDFVKALAGSEGQIRYSINFIPTEVEPPQKSEQKLPTGKCLTEKNPDLKRNIECPICEEYLFAPIYICKSGHTICNVCKPKLTVCPSCNVEICNIRNYTLEAITETIELHCEYRSKGCTFIGDTKTISNHEPQCRFGIRT